MMTLKEMIRILPTSVKRDTMFWSWKEYEDG
jgi:hypothetical protein